MTPIRPPLTRTTALERVRTAEKAWNSRDPVRVLLAYTEDSEWRNLTEFLRGRHELHGFLTRKWQHELDYWLKKELWAFDTGQWYRSYGNEMWEFDDAGLMARRYTSINDAPIHDSERPISVPVTSGQPPEGSR